MILALVSGLTAVMAYFIDTMVAVLFDYKYGFCKSMIPVMLAFFLSENKFDYDKTRGI